MAEKKYNWPVIKEDWNNGKYKTIKELAEKNEMPYTYAKKRVGKWNKEKKLADKIAATQAKKRNPQGNPKGATKKDTQKEQNVCVSPTHTSKQAVPEDNIGDSSFSFVSDLHTPKSTLQSSEARGERLLQMWDALADIVDMALAEPELNFFTNDGQVKAKALSDISMILEKIQKAYDSKDDKGATGQLGEYVKMFDMMKQEHNKGEGDD